MHRCPCALTFPTLNDLRLHQDRCAKYNSVIKLPSSSRTRSIIHERTPDRDAGRRVNQVAESSSTGVRLVKTGKRVQIDRNEERSERSNNDATQPRKRTTLTAVKKITSSNVPAFTAARISPQNAKATSSKQQRATTGPSTESIVATPSKSSTGALLLWQQIDQEYASKNNKTKLKAGRQNFLNPARTRTLRKEVHDKIDINDPSHPRANITPRLRLLVDGKEESSSDSDDTAQAHVEPNIPENIEAVEPPAADVPMGSPHDQDVSESEEEEHQHSSSSSSDSEGRQSTPQNQPLFLPRKAARKIYSIDVSDSEDDEDAPTERDELESERSLGQPNRRSQSSMAPSVYNEPPHHEEGPQTARTAETPITKLQEALRYLTLSNIRMQATKQLPFLRRNLAAGFLKRCRLLGVVVHPDNRPVTLKIDYEHVDGISHRGSVYNFSCPLCGFFGRFPTKEMLECHLTWDHPQVLHEWHFEQDQTSVIWNLKLLIPEVGPQDVQEAEPATPIADTGMSAYDLSILPYVVLSPPRSPESVVSNDAGVRVNYRSPSPLLTKKEEDIYDTSTTLSMSRSAPSPQPQSTGTSTQPDKQVSYRQELLPPLPANPLGPAARYPYLPAASDYGGPTVHYSCRPGGPCLYDLLGTLPLEPYGLLSWEVLDREEEIYESDDIKEEYKIMHAIWARWIMLNRTKFIANYAKGVSEFIDYYWKFIYLACGWDGLRYWLLMLHANRFLTPSEMVKALKRYEKLTGMSDF